jgi:hypothetical protein
MKAHCFFLITGAVFGTIAGLMVFLITYNELLKHYRRW